MGKRKVDMEYCDNPKCDYAEEVSKDSPASGYHFGRGYWVLGGGGPIPPFYAHHEDCIVPAMQAVIEGDY